jgi:hypothetical protein
MYLKYEIQCRRYKLLENVKTLHENRKTVKSKQSYWESLANIFCDF